MNAKEKKYLRKLAAPTWLDKHDLETIEIWSRKYKIPLEFSIRLLLRRKESTTKHNLIKDEIRNQ